MTNQEKKEKSNSKIIALELPNSNLGRLRVVKLNAARFWDSETKKSQYKGAWFKHDDALYEMNVEITLDVDTLQVLSVKPYLRKVELNNEGQSEQ